MSSPECARCKGRPRSGRRAELFVEKMIVVKIALGILVLAVLAVRKSLGNEQVLGQQFSCGKLYYRTFHLDQQRNVLYVGAM